MTDEEKRQLSKMDPANGPKSPEMAGKHTAGGFLSQTNYPGHKVPYYEKEEAASFQKAMKESIEKKMFEPWKTANGPEFYDGISSVKQDH